MQNPQHHDLNALNRRRFFATGASGLGTLALASLMKQDGLLGAGQQLAHFAPRAKRCIYLFMEGGPSQMDLFDPKPRLNELDGQPMPESLLKDIKFAFIQKEAARIMGSPRTFKRYSECGMELSDLLPHLSTCVDDIALIRSMHCEQFNHLPGQLMMLSGSDLQGRPTLGSWLNYGLGNESENLPGYVVLATLGRGLPGGASSWSSGFLPSQYAGTLFRNQGSPVLNLANPPEISNAAQMRSLQTINELNGLRYEQIGNPEISSRIKAYELAFRMQQTAPELLDLSGETKTTLEEYGVTREEASKSSTSGFMGSYARNCLLARRMVERGVRFVSLFLSTWDHHSALDSGLERYTKISDQPVAALLKDLKQRGLLDETLVVWGGEFGRTPLGENRVNFKKVTGRDHHPYSFSMWLAGGGIKGGQVIGETDEIGWGVTKDPVHVHDLHATILKLFGLDHEKLTYR
ncbi:MAG TPA: sulfatase, partial [Planctomycetaceae bacterium]|nr:sulfatase [Planctomycetaceae bacterium]